MPIISSGVDERQLRGEWHRLEVQTSLDGFRDRTSCEAGAAGAASGEPARTARGEARRGWQGRRAQRDVRGVLGLGSWVGADLPVDGDGRHGHLRVRHRTHEFLEPVEQPHRLTNLP